MVASKKKSLLLKSLIGVAVAGLGVGGYFVYKAKFEPPTQSQIDRAMESKDYERAIELISRFDLAQSDGRNYALLGEAQFALGRTDAALAAFMKADDIGYERPRIRLEIARLYEKLGQKKISAQWVADAVRATRISGIGRFDLEEASGMLESNEYRELETAQRTRQGFGELSMADRVGVWTSGSRRSIQRIVVTVERLPGGTAYAELFDSPDGYRAVYVATPDPSVWNYTCSWANGDFIVGQAVITDVITINGTLSYLNGTVCKARVVSQRSQNDWQNSFFVSADEGVTWSLIHEQRWWETHEDQRDVSF